MQPGKRPEARSPATDARAGAFGPSVPGRRTREGLGVVREDCRDRGSPSDSIPRASPSRSRSGQSAPLRNSRRAGCRCGRYSRQTSLREGRNRPKLGQSPAPVGRQSAVSRVRPRVAPGGSWLPGTRRGTHSRQGLQSDPSPCAFGGKRDVGEALSGGPLLLSWGLDETGRPTPVSVLLRAQRRASLGRVGEWWRAKTALGLRALVAPETHSEARPWGTGAPIRVAASRESLWRWAQRVLPEEKTPE